MTPFEKLERLMDNVERLRGEGRNSNALVLIKRALLIDPGNAEIWCTQGHVFLDMQKPERAEAAFRTAIDLDAEGHEGAPDPAYLYGLGISYREQGFLMLAQRSLNEAFKRADGLGAERLSKACAEAACEVEMIMDDEDYHASDAPLGSRPDQIVSMYPLPTKDL